ncbi:hypothetical protein QQ045_018744 [Rhodiola kirilowii]
MNQQAAAMAMGSKYVSWEEVFALGERGRKEAHFYLKRRDRSSDLVVIGREKSSRHRAFVYSVCDGSVLASTQNWSMLRLRSREDVVDWLNSIVSANESEPMLLVYHYMSSNVKSNHYYFGIFQA